MNSRMLRYGARAVRGRLNQTLLPASHATATHVRCAHTTTRQAASTSAHPVSLAALLASAAAATAFAEDKNTPLASSVFEDEPLSVLSRTEAQTGVQFPLALPSGDTLHGMGVRIMRGLVRVYAVGLYVDAPAARTALSDWSGFSHADILSSDDLWAAVCAARAPFRRTLRMVVVREVGGKHMRDGFERALAPRVAAAAKKGRCKPAECKRAMHNFSDLFMRVGTMKVGSDIRIGVEDGVVSLTVDDRRLGEVKNVQLAWAMADMFLGENPVAPTLRNATAEAFEELLKE